MNMKLSELKNVTIRKFSNYVHQQFHLQNVNKFLYYNIHNFFIFVITFIILFNTNISQLTILLFIVSLDAFSIVVLHNCPLSILEKKYLKRTITDERKDILKKMGILYKCDHEYENQIELLINVWMIVACKILCILLLKTVNIKIFDSSKVYL